MLPCKMWYNWLEVYVAKLSVVTVQMKSAVKVYVTASGFPCESVYTGVRMTDMIIEEPIRLVSVD